MRIVLRLDRGAGETLVTGPDQGRKGCEPNALLMCRKERDTSRGSPGSFAAQRTLAQDDKATAIRGRCRLVFCGPSRLRPGRRLRQRDAAFFRWRRVAAGRELR